MKRSEMIEKLREFLLGSSLVKYKSYKDNYCLSDEIIGFLLNQGMLPPFSNEVFQRNAKTQIYPTGNEWDDERSPYAHPGLGAAYNKDSLPVGQSNDIYSRVIIKHAYSHPPHENCTCPNCVPNKPR